MAGVVAIIVNNEAIAATNPPKHSVELQGFELFAHFALLEALLLEVRVSKILYKVVGLDDKRLVSKFFQEMFV